MLTRGYTGSQSTSGAAAVFVVGEEPSGTIDGANVAFTTAQTFTPGSEAVYLNGVRQREGASNDYERSESVPTAGYDTITFTLAPRAGDVVLIDYAV